MTLPNILTIARVVLTIPFMLCAVQDGAVYQIIALVIFVIAAITDKIDGHIARKYNLITTFGKIMDPLADKLLTTAAMLCFVADGRMSVYALMIILAREFAVTSLRAVAADEGKVIAAGIWGKAKTVAQFIYVILMLLDVGKSADGLLFYVEQAAMWIITALTMWSGIVYFYKSRSIIKVSIDKKK